MCNNHAVLRGCLSADNAHHPSIRLALSPCTPWCSIARHTSILHTTTVDNRLSLSAPAYAHQLDFTTHPSVVGPQCPSTAEVHCRTAWLHQTLPTALSIGDSPELWALFQGAPWRQSAAKQLECWERTRHLEGLPAMCVKLVHSAVARRPPAQQESKYRRT